MSSLKEILQSRYDSVFKTSDKQLLKHSMVLLFALLLYIYQDPLSRFVFNEYLQYLTYSLLGIVLLNLSVLLYKFIYPSPTEEVIVRKPPIKPATPKAPVFQSPLMNTPSPSKKSKLLFLRSSPMSPKPDNLINRFAQTQKEYSPKRHEVGLSAGHLSLPLNFQHALKPKQSPVRKEIIEDGLIFVDAEKTLDQWRVHQNIDIWSENIRKWLASKLLQPLVERMDQVDSSLMQMGLGHLKCDSATFAESLNQGGQAKTPYLRVAANQPASLSELQATYGNEPLVKDRMSIERYLTMEWNCRSYIVMRVRELATGSCMSSFKWNSGQKFENKSWNHQIFPSDAYLMMHLFCRFMDEHIPGEGYGIDPRHPFSSKYFVDSPGNNFLGVRIRQASKFPPHFQILIDDTVYDVQSVILNN